MAVGYTLKQFKGLFFDRALVEGKIDTATYKVMVKFGAYLRRSARRNFRRGSAKQPQPPKPRSIQGDLKRFIWFGWEPTRRTLVAGPALLPRQRDKNNPPPKKVERGGNFMTRIKGKLVRQTYREFPFMRDALKKEMPLLPMMWRDTIR